MAPHKLSAKKLAKRISDIQTSRAELAKSKDELIAEVRQELETFMATFTEQVDAWFAEADGTLEVSLEELEASRKQHVILDKKQSEALGIVINQMEVSSS